MEPIEIILDVQTANAAQSVAEFVQATRDGIERAYTSAVDKAQAKLDELNRRQQEHAAVIDLNKQKINDLEAARQKAGSAEQDRLAQEIAKLKELSQARQADISKIEESKVKIETKGLLALEHTDAEAKALHAVTSQRLIDIGSLRDQTKALEAVRDTSQASHERISAGIDEIIRKQQQHTAVINAERQQIDELTAKKASASAFDAEQIDQQISNLQKVVANREQERTALEAKKLTLLEEQSLMGATSEAERHQIQAVTDARMAELGVVQDNARVEQSTRSTMIAGLDSAKLQVDDLSRRQRANADVVEQDKRRLEDLRASRDKASGDERRRLDQEIEGMRKAIAAREIENQTIELKKVKLEETMGLATAQSDLERAAISEQTAGRMAEIGALKDQAKAQSNVTEQTQESDNAIQKYFGRFMGVAGIVLVMRTLTQAIVGQREEIERAIAATDKFHNQNISLDDKFKTFYNEAGLVTSDQQKFAQVAMMKVAGENNLEGSVVASAAAGLAPVLRQHGITDPTSDRYKSMVGNAALFVNRGMDATLVGQYIGDQLNAEPNLTGGQLNQQLSGLLNIPGASPQNINALLGAYQQNKVKLQSEHFSMDDMTKLYSTMAQRGVAPQEIPTSIQQYLRGLGKLQGLGRIGQIDKAMEFAQDELPELAQIMTNAASQNKEVDLREVIDAIDHLSGEHQQKVAEKYIGGDRTLMAIQEGRGWQHTATPGLGKPLVAPENRDQVAKVVKEQVQFNASQRNRTDIIVEQFKDEVEQEATHIEQSPELLPFFQRGAVGSVNILGVSAEALKSRREVAAMNVYGRMLLRQARLLQKTENPNDQQAIIQSMQALRGRIDPGHSSQTLDDIAAGVSLPADGVSDDEFMAGTLPYFGRKENIFDPHTNVLDPKSSIFPISEANKVYNKVTGSKEPTYPSLDLPPMPIAPAGPPVPTAKPTTQPTTQPAQQSSPPVSINYHNRIVNYGYGYDSIGAMQDYANNFG